MHRYLSTLGKNYPKIHEEPSARDMVILFIRRAKDVHCGTTQNPCTSTYIRKLQFIYGEVVHPSSVLVLNIIVHVSQTFKVKEIYFLLQKWCRECINVSFRIQSFNCVIPISLSDNFPSAFVYAGVSTQELYLGLLLSLTFCVSSIILVLICNWHACKVCCRMKYLFSFKINISN